MMHTMFDVEAELILDVVPHCSSTPREGWSSDDDARPLSERGLRQADTLAHVLGLVADAVYSSPALRCRQSVQPLARVAGRPVVVVDRLGEARGFAEPRGWIDGVFGPIGDPLGGSWAAGRAVGALVPLAARHAGEHIVACSHGDTIPVLLAYLAAAHAVELPTPVDRGGWYRLELNRGALSISAHTPELPGDIRKP